MAMQTQWSFSFFWQELLQTFPENFQYHNFFEHPVCNILNEEASTHDDHSR